MIYIHIYIEKSQFVNPRIYMYQYYIYEGSHYSCEWLHHYTNMKNEKLADSK